MRYDNLPIYKKSMEIAVYVETIVKGFDRYNKYTIGADLREKSKSLLFMIHKINISQDKTEGLIKLRDCCEEFKVLIQLTKELKSFKSYKQFEILSKLAVELCRQAQGWLNQSSNKARIKR
jgi:hypothetical protein